MRPYLNTAIILLAVMTFSHVASGQSPRAITPAASHPIAPAGSHALAVLVAPVVGGAQPALPGGAQPAQRDAPYSGGVCTIGSVCVKVPRYDNNVILYGIVEYDLNSCQQLSPGHWNYPAQSALKQPVSTGYLMYTQVVDAHCQTQTYLYAIMCFTWAMHNNHSSPSPSNMAPHPMDTFVATWNDTPGNAAGQCNPSQGPGSGWMPSGDQGPFTVTFNPYVERVLPLGENTQAVGWNQASASYIMTLQCCKPADPGPFDFSGETIDEEITILSDPCGLGAPRQNQTPTVQTGNIWKFDTVGLRTCVPGAAQIWCSQIGPCTFQYSQKLSIHSQADPPNYSATYSTNIQGGTISKGTIINSAWKYASGTISAYRANVRATPPLITLGTGLQGPAGTFYCPGLAAVSCP
jgi:hypothetical protein